MKALKFLKTKIPAHCVLISDQELSAKLIDTLDIQSPSASKPHDKGVKGEQNPRYSHYNGLKSGLNRTKRIPTSMPTTRPQNGKVSCAVGRAKPDGELKRKW
jgi:hypothetical protein